MTKDSLCFCSRLDYAIPYNIPNCGTLELELGCYKVLDCSMTATVGIIHPKKASSPSL
jgi:hypothetical protein